LAPPSLGQRSTWADIVSNTTRDTHYKVPTKQPEGKIECRLEIHFRLRHKSMNPDKNEQAQGTREQGNEQEGRTLVTTPQHMNPEHLIMDTLERPFRATK